MGAWLCWVSGRVWGRREAPNEERGLHSHLGLHGDLLGENPLLESEIGPHGALGPKYGPSTRKEGDN